MKVMSKSKNVKNAGEKNISNKENAIKYGLMMVLCTADKLPMTRGGWNVGDGLRHLVNADSRFCDVITRHGVPLIYDTATDVRKLADETYIPIPVETSPFHGLLKTIVYQQLAGSAAGPIFQRLSLTLGVKEGCLIEPHHVHNAKISVVYIDGKKKITVNDEVSGLSEAKSKYMVDLADHFLDEAKLKDVDLTLLSDEDLFVKLTAVKGLGPWSVHMFMLFDLQRANVLATGDLGVRRGLSVFHGHAPTYFEKKTNQADIPTLCASWTPYSSLGCWYMWRLSEEFQQHSKAADRKRTATEVDADAAEENITTLLPTTKPKTKRRNSGKK